MYIDCPSWKIDKETVIAHDRKINPSQSHFVIALAANTMAGLCKAAN